MNEFSDAFTTAFELIVTWDGDLANIVGLSLQVSLSAVGIAALIGLPIGAAVAIFRFPGRSIVTAVLNAFMGLPPVVIGLVVYLMLSRAGPLGSFGILFTPAAMVVAQCVLVTPLIAALARQIVEDLYAEYAEQFRSLDVSPLRAIPTLLWDGRYSLSTAIFAGFGRAVAEVGAVIVVGGNIDHLTRVMTSAIALETSKGDLPLALALGVVLLAIALAVNALVMALRSTAQRYAYA
jgi:tungstate transport system permease protein